MKLTSYGAAEEVTGSCHLIEVAGQRVLLECGLIQGQREEEARNVSLPTGIHRCRRVKSCPY